MADYNPTASQQQQDAQNYAQGHPAFSNSAMGEQETSREKADDPQFDIFEWHPKYISCQRYFLDRAQHSAPVQAMAAFMNMQLPCQRNPPVSSSRVPADSSTHQHPPSYSHAHGSAIASPASTSRAVPATNFSSPDPPSTSLFPFLRRLVVTGLDYPGVLHGFFGDDWAAGIGPLHEQERRNLLFAAKSSGWMGVKKDYDHGPHETVPFLRPLQQAVEAEVSAAERSWSEWLAMEDWMVGPRAPAGTGGAGAAPAAAGGTEQSHSGETRMGGTERVGEGFAS